MNNGKASLGVVEEDGCAERVGSEDKQNRPPRDIQTLCVRLPSTRRGNGTMIQLADARRIIAPAEKKAEEIGQLMNVAVVNEVGNLITFDPMTTSCLVSIHL